PEFKAIHLPNAGVMEREFDFGAGGAQCLVRDGQDLILRPPPAIGAPIPKGPFPSTESEAGHIPMVDHMLTSRTSLGWSKDSRRLYLLIVKEPDSEMASALAFRHGEPESGGWSVAELQRFWLSLGVWGAVNLDGGG